MLQKINLIFGKLYVKGTILVDGHRKSVKLHRYIFDIIDSKYKQWYVDHINGNPLDNRLNNMTITDAKGNGHKINSKCYSKRSDSTSILYRVNCTLGGIKYDKTFKLEKDAIEFGYVTMMVVTKK